MNLTYPYSDDNFFFSTRHAEQSQLDSMLQSIWKNKVEEGCFRYELGDLKTKCLSGKYNFIVQLNIKRAIERRKPQLVSDVVMRFDPDKFHFGKIQEREVIFNIEPQHWKDAEKCKNVLLINVSPLEYCHSLLVPCIEKCFPQVLNFEGLRLAAELMLGSQDSCFRIGFNSLGGFASVNHLHFHAYYLKYKLFLEHAINSVYSSFKIQPYRWPTNHFKGPCYELIDFPSEGFVFEILLKKDILEIIRSVLSLIDFLIENKIAHNVFLTRGTPLSEPNVDANELHSLRIYVWARETCYGVKDEMSFNIAVCELAGHIPMKDKVSFENITEDEIALQLNKVCHKTFVSIKERVMMLYP